MEVDRSHYIETEIVMDGKKTMLSHSPDAKYNETGDLIAIKRDGEWHKINPSETITYKYDQS